MEIVIRHARHDDIPTLQSLIVTSVRGLQTGDYTAEQIEWALLGVYGVDTQLINDGTYFVAERTSDATIAGCGGWSKRQTLCGGDQWTERSDSLLDPSRDAAKIRAFFIDPRSARRGIGSRILAHCEAAAAAAGFTRFEMGATLTGMALYAAHGYRVTACLAISLGGGETLPIVHMEKSAVAADLSANLNWL